MKIHYTFAAALIALTSSAAFAQMPATTLKADPTTSPDPAMMKMDKDGDGKISKQEAQGAVRAHFDQWDVNHDGMIDTAEFSAAGINSKK
jgi:Ca2+-binding EF-hand superfamily protein